MKTSNNGISIICRFEGLRLQSYMCSAGILTIGFGHTGPEVKEHMTITKDKAVEFLKADLQKFEDRLRVLVKIPLLQHEFDALISLMFNIGAGAFSKSTLLKWLNEGRKMDASLEFLSWNKIAGQPISGLTTRRSLERDLFLGKDIICMN